MTKDSITDDQLRAVIEWSLKGRQNSIKRAMRKDAQAALGGDAVCRESVASWIERKVREVVLPPGLVAQIETYLERDWSQGDPSRFGALNAVAYIGERLIEIYRTRRAEVPGAEPRKEYK